MGRISGRFLPGSPLSSPVHPLSSPGLRRTQYRGARSAAAAAAAAAAVRLAVQDTTLALSFCMLSLGVRVRVCSPSS